MRRMEQIKAKKGEKNRKMINRRKEMSEEKRKDHKGR